MRRTPSSSAAKALVALGLVLLGGDVAYRAGVGRGDRRPRSDAFAYEAGARALFEGRSPFGARDARTPELPYVYPPAIALVVAPLVPLGGAGFPVAWFALNVSVLFGGARALARALGGARRTWLVPLVLLALPLASGLQRGQIGPMLAGLLAYGCARLAEKRDLEAGLALGAAVALKATPVLALFALALERRPRALAGASLALVAMLGVGPAVFLGIGGAVRANVDFLQGMPGRYARDPASAELEPGRRDYDVLGKPVNQSLVAVEWRALGGSAAYGPLALATAALATVGSLVPAARGRGRGTPPQLVASVGVAGAATLLASPVAWHHHHVVLWPVIAALVAEAPPQASRTKEGLAGFLALEVLHFAVEPLRPLGLLGLATIAPLALAGRLAWERGSASGEGARAPGGS